MRNESRKNGFDFSDNLFTQAESGKDLGPRMTHDIENVVKLREVFGVGRDVPLNYVARPEVDNKFIESLSRDKHVVIYGSSKQGKTTLRRHCLQEDDYIVVSCLNTMSLADLNGAVLKAAGYRIEQTQTKTTGGAWKYGAEFAGEGKVPFVAKASVKGSLNRENNTRAVSERCESQGIPKASRV